VKLLALRVEDVMIRKVHTIDSEFPTRYAARMMGYLRVSSLVAIDQGVVVGIITERDIVSKIVSKALDPEKVLVKDIMSSPVITTRPNSLLEAAIKYMLDNGIKKLPVLAGDGGRDLVGILSLTDVARLHPSIYASLLEYQNESPLLVNGKIQQYIQ